MLLAPCALCLVCTRTRMTLLCFCFAHRAPPNPCFPPLSPPQNLLLDRATGAVKVADFGLARNATPPLRPFTHEVCPLPCSLALPQPCAPAALLPRPAAALCPCRPSPLRACFVQRPQAWHAGPAACSPSQLASNLS
jgi:serine/threonine protein kinase